MAGKSETDKTEADRSDRARATAGRHTAPWLVVLAAGKPGDKVAVTGGDEKYDVGGQIGAVAIQARIRISKHDCIHLVCVANHVVDRNRSMRRGTRQNDAIPVPNPLTRPFLRKIVVNGTGPGPVL